MNRGRKPDTDPETMLASGALRTTSELLGSGVAKATLWRAVKAGRVAQVARGIFGTPDVLTQDKVNLAAVSLANPGCVVCLLSAARLHEITDEDPYRLWVAVRRSETKNPAKGGPDIPTQTVWWKDAYFEDGVESRQYLGVKVSVTDLPRTVVDLIRYRGKLGDEPAMKALHDYVRANAPIGDLWKRAKAIGHLDVVEPFIRAADEFRESVAARSI